MQSRVNLSLQSPIVAAWEGGNLECEAGGHQWRGADAVEAESEVPQTLLPWRFVCSSSSLPRLADGWLAWLLVLRVHSPATSDVRAGSKGESNRQPVFHLVPWCPMISHCNFLDVAPTIAA